MKLAAIYNIWDGEDLLEGSISQIRPFVDTVIVVWSNAANWMQDDGKQHLNPTLAPLLNWLYKQKTIDKLIQYEPPGARTYRQASQAETHKRQLGINYAKKTGHTHFLNLDADEYYLPAEFDSAKRSVGASAFCGSAVSIQAYLTPELKFEALEGYYVPFIHSLKPDTITGVAKYPFYVDPTRRINCTNIKLFPRVSAIMHHFTYNRKDISQKYQNSTAKKSIVDAEKYCFDILDAKKTRNLWGRTLVDCENIFNINGY